MHQRSPRRSIALDQDLAGGDRVADQVVDHEVGPQAGRQSVGGGVPHVGGAEVVVGERRDVPLGHDLRLAVGSQGVERRLLVEEALARSVQAARRGEDVSLHPPLLGELGQADRGPVVDLVGQVRVQVAQRVVGQSGQVDDGIEPVEVFRSDLAHVDPARGRLIGGRGPQHARREQAEVHPDRIVPGVGQHGHHDRTYVASGTSDQYTHGVSFGAGGPSPPTSMACS